MEENPLVSISLITYNHKKYIRKAIESVLHQCVDFKYELIIGDDFSSDGTRDIIKEYSDKYPNIIHPILHPQRNSGVPGKINFVSTVYASRGKYIALLDGDDYWGDNFKLQKQVNFLEENPNYVISFHDSIEVDEEGKLLTKSMLGKHRQKSLSSEEIISGVLIPANTVLFRNGIIKKFPKEFFTVLNGDTFTFALLAQHGKAYYQSDIQPSGYRIHNNGVWSLQGKTTQIENRLNTYRQLLMVIDDRYSYLIRKQLFIRTMLFAKNQTTNKEKVKMYFSSFRYFYLSSELLREVTLINLHFIKKLFVKYNRD